MRLRYVGGQREGFPVQGLGFGEAAGILEAGSQIAAGFGKVRVEFQRLAIAGLCV